MNAIASAASQAHRILSFQETLERGCSNRRSCTEPPSRYSSTPVPPATNCHRDTRELLSIGQLMQRNHHLKQRCTRCQHTQADGSPVPTIEQKHTIQHTTVKVINQIEGENRVVTGTNSQKHIGVVGSLSSIIVPAPRKCTSRGSATTVTNHTCKTALCCLAAVCVEY